jgi:predicted transcriptional regulator
MACPPQDITETELAILQALWERSPATIRALTDALYPKGRASHYATVQKLLERLEAKGFVHRDRSAAVHTFSATLGRDELINRRLQSMAEKLCGGSLATLLTQLVTARPLTAEELTALRTLIDKLEASSRPRNARR